MVSATIPGSRKVFEENIVVAKGGPTTHRMIIDRELAISMLERNTKNRKMADTHIATLSRERSEGRWLLNGDPIKFTRTGVLCDGQHRLTMVVRTGLPIETLVVFGLDPGAFATLGPARKRSCGDTLSVLGEVDCNRLAGALGSVASYYSETYSQMGHSRLSPTQIENVLDEHPDLRKSVRRYGEPKKLMAGSLFAALHYICSRKSAEQADEFFNAVMEGSGIQHGDPAFMVRDRLLTNSLSRQKKLTPHALAAIVLKGWNSFRAKRTVSCIRWRDGEDFPKAR